MTPAEQALERLLQVGARAWIIAYHGESAMGGPLGADVIADARRGAREILIAFLKTGLLVYADQAAA